MVFAVNRRRRRWERGCGWGHWSWRATRTSPLHGYSPVPSVWPTKAFHEERFGSSRTLIMTVPFSVLLRGIRGQPTPAPLETWVWLGSLVLEGDAYVAPTRIFPGPLGLAYKGASWGTFRFVPHLIMTVPFSVLLRGIRGQPTPAPLGTWVWLGSSVLEGDAYVAPTRIFPGPLGWAYKGASWGTFRFVPQLNHDCPLLRPSPWYSRSTDAGAAGNVGVVGVIGLGGRRVRRPYTDIPRSPRLGLQRRFMGNVSVRPAP